MPQKIGVHVRLEDREVVEGQGGAAAVGDVLTLSVRQVVAVCARVPGGGVAGEADATAAVGVGVAEDHLHDGHRGAQVVADALVRSALARTPVPPRPQAGVARQ